MSEHSGRTFFSYAREDTEFALRLAKDLRARGANIWVDQLDILPGEHWDSAVEEALESCPRLLVILSPASVKSKNVMDEVSFALEEGKQVIPALHHGCRIPFRLRRVQYVDFTNNYGDGIAAVLKTLEIGSRSTAGGTAGQAVPIRPNQVSTPQQAPLQSTDAKELSEAPLPESEIAEPVRGEHLELLGNAIQKKDMRLWNQWREGNPDVRPNLRAGRLADVNIRKANLREADLRGANLSGADLMGAQLEGADLSSAVLSGADLLGAQLGNAILRQANLSRTNLFGAKLARVYLQGANLSGAIICGADLLEARLDSADLRGANLAEAYLKKADLIGANLEGANLDGACLYGANLLNTVSLTQAQINSAAGDKHTRLPEHLHRPNHWR